MTTAPNPSAEPSWLARCSKAIAAGAVSLVVGGPLITAALASAYADDRVTVLEGWTIALAVLGALAGPVVVYSAPRNAERPRIPPVDAPQVRLPGDGDSVPHYWQPPS